MTSFPGAGFVPISRPSSSAGGSAWFRLADDGRCFEGHFDASPVLPGVAHLALALSALDREKSDRRVLAGLRDVRLRHALHPGDEVEVVLAEIAEPAAVRFEIRRGGELASAGLLIFASSGDVVAP